MDTTNTKNSAKALLRAINIYSERLWRSKNRTKSQERRLKLLARLLMTGAVVVCVTGCAGTGHMGQYAQLSGSPEGLRALGDTLIGMNRTAKESPEQTSEYFAHRHNEMKHETERARIPGFFQGIFAKQQ
jgi:hypothetical protein